MITVDGVLGAAFGLGTATGLVLIAAGLRASRTPVPTQRLRGPVWRRTDRRRVLRATGVAGAVLLAGVVTGWPVGAVLAGAAVWFLPRLLGPDRAHTRRVARIEAIAAWTEMLRDTLSAAAGLEQAILVTAPLAPAAIRGEVTTLAASLENGQRLAPALRQLAEELAEATADLVIAALVLAAEHQARQLAALLGSLAATAREHAAMRMRTEAGRARTRTSVRVIVATTLAFAVAVVLFNRAYLAAYDTTLGQTVLVAIGVLFATGFAWLTRITTTGQTHRVLAATTPEPAHPSDTGYTAVPLAGRGGDRP